MVDYEALSIAPLCNVDIDVLGPQGHDWQGHRDVCGLPFRIGDDVARVALFGGDGHHEPQTLGVARTARTLTFAHTVVSSRLPEGDVSGALVATYRVH